MFHRSLATVILLLISSALQGGEWAFFRGPDMNGTAPAQGINKDWKARPPAVLWKATLPDASNCGPCVADGKVFIQVHKTDTDAIWAFDLTSGKQVWESLYPSLIGEGYGYEKASPAWSDGKLYVISRSGLITCVSSADGKSVWSKHMVSALGGRQPQFHYAGSPLVDGNNLIVCPGGATNSVVALDKATGNLVWSTTLPDALSYSTPILTTLNGKKQIVVALSATIFGLDPATGKMIWSFAWKTPNGINASTPLPVGDDQIFYASGYEQGCVLFKVSGSSATELWRNKEMKSTYSSPVFMNGNVYGIGAPDVFACLDIKTGKPAWKINGYNNGGVLGVDGTVICMVGNGGCCSMVDAASATYKELSRFNPIPDGTSTAPILADKKMIVRGGKGLACVDLK